MKEPYIEGLANHDDPESCVCIRKDAGEALTGESVGEVLSRETYFEVLTLLSEGESNTRARDRASTFWTSRGRRPSACVDTLCAGTERSHIYSANVGRPGRIGKAKVIIR